MHGFCLKLHTKERDAADIHMTILLAQNIGQWKFT